MTTTYKPTALEMKAGHALLREAAAHLGRFLEPNSERCAVAPEVREAAHLYLESWVEGPLLEAMRAFSGGLKEYELTGWLSLLHETDYSVSEAGPDARQTRRIA